MTIDINFAAIKKKLQKYIHISHMKLDMYIDIYIYRYGYLEAIGDKIYSEPDHYCKILIFRSFLLYTKLKRDTLVLVYVKEQYN